MVSVIIATYRRDQSLSNALESLAKQTYSDFEVVLIDDNADAEWNQKVDFQGFDIRIFNEEQGEALSQLKFHKTFKFAWDNPRDNLDDKIELLLDYITVEKEDKVNNETLTDEEREEYKKKEDKLKERISNKSKEKKEEVTESNQTIQ